MADFEKLKNIDLEELYSKTFIARKNLKYILDKDFSKLDRLRAIGFVNIIEREFGLDLSDLKEEINNYFSSNESIEVKKISSSNNKKSNRFFIIGLFLIFFIVVAILFLKNGDSKDRIKIDSIDKKEDFFEKNSTLIDENEKKELNAIENLEVNQTDVVDETNTTSSNETNITKEQKSKVKAVLPTILIVPKQKIWLGIIYLDDYSKKSYLTSSVIELNSSRDQLILTGHGHLKIDSDGNVTDFSDKNRLRFLYRAGILEKIDKKTFENFNRGKSW